MLNDFLIKIECQKSHLLAKTSNKYIHGLMKKFWSSSYNLDSFSLYNNIVLYWSRIVGKRNFFVTT